MRRVYHEPPSRLARWSWRLALVSAAMALIAVVATRLDWLDGNAGEVAMIGACAVAGAALLTALIAGVVIWHSGYGGARKAVAASLLALMVIAGPTALLAQSWRLPRINDITTDIDDVPDFKAVAAARPRGSNGIVYGGAAIAQQQKRAYAAVKPLLLDIQPDDLEETLDDLIRERRWFMLSRTAFRGKDGEGRIEMVARSLLFGLRDDIVLRAREVEGRVKIDMRSASRYGRWDFGSNARRITEFLDDLRLAAK